MITIDSTQVKQGRYVSGGQTESNAYALEWWERAVLQNDISDELFVVDITTEGRADLIAAAMLGDSKLIWLLLQYNAILDPASEITVGRVLRVPTKQRVQNMLDGKTGGYPSTREVPLTNITPIV